ALRRCRRAHLFPGSGRQISFGSWHSAASVPAAPPALALAGAAGLAALLAQQRLRPAAAEELDDEDDDDDIYTAQRAWTGCHPVEPVGGNRVFVWGQRASYPSSEATGDRPPDGSLRMPTE
ncbi:unnamed protein product, partial [Polarella glacialis]